MFASAMVARADLDRHLHNGWHNNTWGGGKIFDNQIACAVLDILLHEKSPVFLGRSYQENLRLKSKLIQAGFAELQSRHPAIVVGSMVQGGLARLSVRRRTDLIRAGWRRGLKLLGCGRSGDVAAIRTIWLADVLAKEIREAMDLLDLAMSDVE
jgi:4-aminobutyrate aminotransferase-like enzyme